MQKTLNVRLSSTFEKLLLEALDRALVDALGQDAAAAVKFSIDTSVITKNPQAFQDLIAKIFSENSSGSSMSKLIDQSIRKWFSHLLHENYREFSDVSEKELRENLEADGDLVQFIAKEKAKISS